MMNKCNICQSPVSDTESEIVYADGSVDLMFERRCVVDHNLVYGSIKRIKQGGI